MTTKGNDLFMTRGDDASFLAFRELPDGTHLPFEDGDVVRFTVRLAKKPKEDSKDDRYVFQKVITEFDKGYAVVRIEPKDTRDLPTKPDYAYDCELTTKDGLIDTFIKWSSFTLGKEAT